MPYIEFRLLITLAFMEVWSHIKEWIHVLHYLLRLSDHLTLLFSSFVLIRKADGSLLLCNNYRLLNTRTMKDNNALPMDYLDWKITKQHIHKGSCSFTQLQLCKHVIWNTPNCRMVANVAIVFSTLTCWQKQWLRLDGIELPSYRYLICHASSINNAPNPMRNVMQCFP